MLSARCCVAANAKSDTLRAPTASSSPASTWCLPWPLITGLSLVCHICLESVKNFAVFSIIFSEVVRF